MPASWQAITIMMIIREPNLGTVLNYFFPASFPENKKKPRIFQRESQPPLLNYTRLNREDLQVTAKINVERNLRSLFKSPRKTGEPL